MLFNIIASGSKGNATLIRSKNALIQIDMGISLTRLNEGLKEINCRKDMISAAFFTHEHADHISGIRFLSPTIIYGLGGTLCSSLNNEIQLFETVQIGDIKITPFPTSHDAKSPCGYVIEADNEKLTYMTDTGVVLEEAFEIMNNPDYLIIESNHDIQMLMKTNRPYELKNRILSEHGHLCNEDSALATLRIIGNKTKEIYLAHISEEANLPEVALNAYKDVFTKFNKDISSYKIKVANQWHSTIGGKSCEN